MKLYKNLKQKWIVISNHEMLNNYFNLAILFNFTLNIKIIETKAIIPSQPY